MIYFQIRLIRQAAEWGPRYQFWSCSDVDIVTGDSGTKDCGEFGEFDEVSESCKCGKFR